MNGKSLLLTFLMAGTAASTAALKLGEATFGHAMHSMLTWAKHARFSGTSVPRDFVEAPSQMLENWVWDKRVLDSFAADYRDPSQKIPREILAKFKEARLATEGGFYRRQLSVPYNWQPTTDNFFHAAGQGTPSRP